MNHLTVTTATVNSVANTYTTIAAEIASAGAHLDVGDAGLVAVFGLIGTEFASAVHSSTRDHRDRVDALAAAARRIATDLHAAGGAYTATDRTTGSAITAAGPGTRVA